MGWFNRPYYIYFSRVCMKRNVVLVCGGRNYIDRSNVYQTLDLLHADKRITLLVQGFALGADQLAHQWALWRNVPSTGRKYQITSRMWSSQGKRAGWIRNKRMRDEERPDLVVAFPRQ